MIFYLLTTYMQAALISQNLQFDLVSGICKLSLKTKLNLLKYSFFVSIGKDYHLNLGKNQADSNGILCVSVILRSTEL